MVAPALFALLAVLFLVLAIPVRAVRVELALGAGAAFTLALFWANVAVLL